MASNHSKAMEMSSEMDSDDDDIAFVPAMSNLALEDCTSKPYLFEKPACLIYTDDKGQLEIDNNVLSQLSKIEKKISVVGICGMYRSGKSYLMNLIAGEKRGFTLGNTVQSETKGIWIRCIKHPKHEDTVLVLVDTEGLDDPEKGDPSHDNNLFCLTHLMCSILIINVKGVFDYGVLDKLAFIGTLAESIKTLDDENKHNAKIVSVASPRLVMCIRDFFLQNEMDGKPCTPDEYFAEKLKPGDEAKPNQAQFNKTKRAITNFYPKRKCFTIAQPATGEDLLNIESLADNAIDKKFLQDLEDLKKYVYDKKPKQIFVASTKQINGAVLAGLITQYVNDVREKTPIRCEVAYTQASKKHNEQVLEKAMKDFKKEMKDGKTMTSKTSLQTLFLGIFEKTLARYRDESFLYQGDETEDKAKEQMIGKYGKMIDKLKKRSQKIGAEKASKMYDEMLKTNKEIYSSPDGYVHYEKDMEILQEKLFEEMKDYDKDDLCVAFEEFKKSKKDERMSLYRTSTDGKAQQQQYQELIEEMNKTMEKRFQVTLETVEKMRNVYEQKETEFLRSQNQLLYKILEERKSCSIM